MPVKASRRPFRPANKLDGKGCSLVTVIASFLLVIWLWFIVYCWRSGLIGFNNVIGSVVSDVSPQIGVSEKGDKSQLRSEIAIPEQIIGKPDSSSFTNEYLKEIENSDIHVIFSTDCNPYQDWQSLLVFHSAKMAGQKGLLKFYYFNLLYHAHETYHVAFY